MGGFKIFIIIVVVCFVSLYLLVMGMKKSIAKMSEERRRKKAEFRAMGVSGRRALSDEELFEIVTELIEDKDIEYGVPGTCFPYLNRQEQIVYVVYDYYESVFMSDSSLRDYFGSEKRDVCVARTSDCLMAVGAYDHQQVFEGFVSENGINLTDLSGFKSYWDDDYKTSTDGYSYDGVNEKLRALPDIKRYITKYIRENVEFF